MSIQPIYDLIIIGSGPAGLAASIYASRYKLTNLVIGKVLGGTMTYAHRVENYPGFTSISGVELAQKMGEQVRGLGAEILAENVTEIQKANSEGGNSKFKIITENGSKLESKALVVATGTERRRLNISGETEYLGRGVSYCTTCDIPFFKDKTVVVVGGSDSACTGAIHAADFAKKVYLIYRRQSLRAEPVWVEEVRKNSKIEVIYDSNIKKILGYKDIEILGEETKKSLNIEISKYRNIDSVIAVELDKPYRGNQYLVVDGIFVEIGGVPLTSLLAKIGVNLDEKGFVKVTPDMSTNITGLYAAGDLANVFGEFYQITAAVAEGSLAAASVYKYLKGQQAPKIVGKSN